MTLCQSKAQNVSNGNRVSAALLILPISISLFILIFSFRGGQQQQLAVAQNLSNLTNLQSLLPEAALADYAYNQALFQLFHRNPAALTAAQNPLASVNATAANANAAAAQLLNPNGNGISPVPGANSSNASSGSGGGGSGAAAAAAAAAVSSAAGLESDFGLNPDSFEPPIETDFYPTTMYSCLICANFNTNQIDELNQHLLIDRSRTTAAQNQQDVMLIINNNYICRLCNYKTTLKANFQLHSKTDKHIQKLNYINHIKEGGASNEYKLKYNSNNTVQLKCNCCDYYTNSIQKLNLHSQNIRHESMKIIFTHFVQTMQTVAALNDTNDAPAIKSNASKIITNETKPTDDDESGADKSNDTTDNMESGETGATQNAEQHHHSDDEPNDGNENVTNQTISVKSADELNDTAKDSTTSATSSISVKCTDDLIDTSTKETTDTNNSGAQNSATTATSANATNINSDNNNKVLMCQLCNYKANHILGMVQHVKSFQHMQIEHLICMQRAKENLDSLELTDVFTIAEAGK